ncbi:transposase-like protein [Lachnospiraceae bacterium PF1-4]
MKGKIKGTIYCPVCNKDKIVVYEGASGLSSYKCSNCRRLRLVDYDTMSAELGEPEKGLFSNK